MRHDIDRLSWLIIFAVPAFLDLGSVHASTKDAPLGTLAQASKPEAAITVVPGDLLLEKLTLGGDMNRQTFFLADPVQGRVWEIAPDHTVYATMRLKPWKPRKATALKTISAWLRDIPKAERPREAP